MNDNRREARRSRVVQRWPLRAARPAQFANKRRAAPTSALRPKQRPGSCRATMHRTNALSSSPRYPIPCALSRSSTNAFSFFPSSAAFDLSCR